MKIEMIGGRLDGETTTMFWPRVGQRREFCLESTHVYEVQYRRAAGRGGLVLRLVKSYRPATQPANQSGE